jgi:hypothetical protein
MNLNWHNNKIYILREGKSFIFQLDHNTKHLCLNKKKEIFGYSSHSIYFGDDDIFISDNCDQN